MVRKVEFLRIPSKRVFEKEYQKQLRSLYHLPKKKKEKPILRLSTFPGIKDIQNQDYLQTSTPIPSSPVDEIISESEDEEVPEKEDIKDIGTILYHLSLIDHDAGKYWDVALCVIGSVVLLLVLKILRRNSSRFLNAYKL